MADSESKQGDVFDEERLKRLVELMKEQGLQEVELREGEQQIRICRAISGPVYPAHAGPYPPSYPPPAAPQPPLQQSQSAPQSPPASETEGEHIVVIKSPMVGTFYSKPNPNTQAYVKVGDHVEPETTICIIEAMKVFNEIPAEVSGKIVAILLDNEEPIEFGKPLFKVDTRG
jgi:acetyl-CoA carboxylase biotin carboxyl carrier protein